MPLNKSDLAELLAAKLSITYSEAERMINAFINVIYESLKNGDSVNISGFGQFSVAHRSARIGVLPRVPSQKIQIPEYKTPKFRAGEAFKEAVRIRKGSSGGSQNNHSEQ